uniref:MARVEL domain-containing protein n=1 Tax=Globodera rostochiensis TaxID=31243 RepID=A0A914H368_GLORO
MKSSPLPFHPSLHFQHAFIKKFIFLEAAQSNKITTRHIHSFPHRITLPKLVIHNIIVNKSPSVSVPSTDRPYSPTPPKCLSVESLQLPSAAKVPMSAASGQTHRRIVIGAGMPTPHRSRPPLRFDRTFLEERDNQLKLIQLLCGLVAFLLTVQCWPNPLFPYCLGRIVNFFQLFNAVCVHGFFLLGTFFLALAHLFSAPDAFYYYNFSLLEQFYCGLASVMYLIGSVFAILNMSRAIFALLWFFHLFVTLACLGLYTFDLWTRWKRDKQFKKDQQHNQSAYIT